MPIRTEDGSYHEDDCPLFDGVDSGEEVDAIPPGDSYADCPVCQDG